MQWWNEVEEAKEVEEVKEKRATVNMRNWWIDFGSRCRRLESEVKK
jgi:hypothetical protein